MRRHHPAVEEDELERLDRAGYPVLEALTYVRSPPKASAYTPHLFACMDGNSYWIKYGAQQGLVSELVAGRLALQAEAGPNARVIRVRPESWSERLRHLNLPASTSGDREVLLGITPRTAGRARPSAVL